MKTTKMKTIAAAATFALLSINPAMAKEADKAELKVPAQEKKVSKTLQTLEGFNLPMFATFSAVSTL